MTTKKKPSSPQSASPPPLTPTDAPTYTWDAVLAAVPAPAPEETARYSPLLSPADLIASGARIRSEKILTDLLRFAGTVADFLPKATPQQRKLLLGFSEPFFRVAVHEGKKLRDMVASRSTNLDGREAELQKRAEDAAQKYTDGLDERQRLVNALEGLVPYDASLAGRVDRARDRVTDAKSLAKSLNSLVKLLRDILGDTESVAAGQLADGGVTETELVATEKLAADIERTGALASGARALGPVTQAELDRQDGVCLLHIERLMKVFNGAHARDPSIPQLIAIATRSIFAPTRRQRPESPPPAKDPPPTGDDGSGGSTKDGP